MCWVLFPPLPPTPIGVLWQLWNCPWLGIRTEQCRWVDHLFHSFYVILVAGSPPWSCLDAPLNTSVAWPLLNHWVSPPPHLGLSLYLSSKTYIMSGHGDACLGPALPGMTTFISHMHFWPLILRLLTASSCSKSPGILFPVILLPLPTHYPLVISLTSIVRVWSPSQALISKSHNLFIY